MDYREFLESKRVKSFSHGIEVCRESLHPKSFEFQKDIALWSLRKGRCAIFADTGLGKSLMEIEWHRHTSDRGLIAAPLAVAKQMVREGEKWGIPVTYARCEDDAPKSGIAITNYDMLRHFDPRRYGSFSLNESSIIKSFTSSIRNQIMEEWRVVPLRLASTATPAPNDYMELGNHAEFLGIMSRTEMLAEYFVHDGGDTSKWRLKGHAEEDFWKWIATWAIAIRKPSDFGYSDDAYNLPPLTTIEHIITNQTAISETLFHTEALTLNDQRKSKRQTQGSRVEKMAAIVAQEPEESWIIWCELNSEGDALEKAIPGAVQVQGSDSLDFKEIAMMDFVDGKIRSLISKSSIFGFGMNWQHCARIGHVGLDHSFERRYQGIRRCWRFGQTREVICHDVYADTETAILRNLKRKQEEAKQMQDAMIAQMQSVHSLTASKAEKNPYTSAVKMSLPTFLGGEN